MILQIKCLFERIKNIIERILRMGLKKQSHYENKACVKKVILVGNGFDLAHSLETGYGNFATKENDPALKKFHDLVKVVDDCEPIIDENGNVISISWYDFERNIERLANWVYQKNFSDEEIDIDYMKNIKEIEEYNTLFGRIADLLYVYLENEYNRQEEITLHNVSEEISDDAYVFSFNYTDTIKRYTDNYYFVHGSIVDDNEIVLGFATDMISDLSDSEYRKYTKEQLRERLNYIRFLNDSRCVGKDALLKEFEPHLDMLFSGRGGYDLPEKETDNETCYYDTSEASEPLKTYAERNNFLPAHKEFKFDKVEEVVIMGHGLEADCGYIENIFEKIPYLKKVKLYTYEEENKTDLERKKQYIKSMAPDCEIEIKTYE